jgi:hypothetical protein
MDTYTDVTRADTEPLNQAIDRMVLNPGEPKPRLNTPAVVAEAERLGMRDGHSPFDEASASATTAHEAYVATAAEEMIANAVTPALGEADSFPSRGANSDEPPRTRRRPSPEVLMMLGIGVVCFAIDSFLGQRVAQELALDDASALGFAIFYGLVWTLATLGLVGWAYAWRNNLLRRFGGAAVLTAVFLLVALVLTTALTASGELTESSTTISGDSVTIDNNQWPLVPLYVAATLVLALTLAMVHYWMRSRSDRHRVTALLERLDALPTEAEVTCRGLAAAQGTLAMLPELVVAAGMMVRAYVAGVLTTMPVHLRSRWDHRWLLERDYDTSAWEAALTARIEALKARRAALLPESPKVVEQ